MEAISLNTAVELKDEATQRQLSRANWRAGRPSPKVIPENLVVVHFIKLTKFMIYNEQAANVS